MANADDILGHYLGEALPAPSGKSANSADAILDHYLSGGVAETTVPAPAINSDPHPPISGVTPERSAEINSYPLVQGGGAPRRYSSPKTFLSDVASSLSELPGDIVRSTGEAARGGIETFKQGAEDVMSNRPATGVGRMGMGALQYVASPISGATTELVEKPIANLTGNKEIGERAGQVVSLALPVAPAGKAVNAARPTVKAFKDLVDAVGEKNIPAVLAELKSNPRLSLMDVSPSVLQTTQKLAVTPGPQQHLLSNVVEQRLLGAKGAVEGAYDSAMGAPVNVLDKLNSMKEAARNIGKKEIAPAIIGAKPVDISPVITHIDQITKPGVNSVISSGSQLPTTEVKQALTEVRKLLTNGKELRTDADTLHSFQSALRSEADTLLSSPNGADKLKGRALMNVRSKIVDAIDAASPQVNGKGTYRQGLGKYADEKQIDEAFNKGTEILRNRSTKYDDRPEFWEDWVKNAKPSEVDAAKEGARIAVDNQINGMRFAAKRGTDIPEVEFNKEKLSLLFGKKEVEEMATKLKHEKQIADSNNKLFQGSQTAMRNSADTRVAQRTDKGMEGNILPYLAEGIAAYSTGLPGIGATAYKVADIGKRKLVNPVLNKMSDQKNYEFARLASASGSERDELIKRLSDLVTPPKQSLLSRSSQALSKVIAP